jgi:hypothetical protein
MSNETIPVQVPTKVYLDLAYQLRRSGDMRGPDEIIALAIRSWMAGRTGTASRRGYQWQELFLPEGTELKMRYRGIWYYAAVEKDQLVYAGETVSPREWCLLVTGTVRNAWRDIWIRRSANECWTRALMWRSNHERHPHAPGTDRRRQPRRSTD